MTNLKKLLSFGAAFALATTPVIASTTSPASKLSVSASIRANPKIGKTASDLRGGSTVVAVGAAALVALAVILLAGGSSSP